MLTNFCFDSKNNLVSGVDRVAFRIQGNGCPLTNPVPSANNIYENNEVHSAMAGVSIWPSDKGFYADRGNEINFRILIMNSSILIMYFQHVFISLDLRK